VADSLLAAFHVTSPDDGLTWSSPAHLILKQGNEQSLARGALLLPSGLLAVAYESLGPGRGFEALELRLWLSDGRDLLLDDMDGYTQAYGEGGSAYDGGAPFPMSTHGDFLNITYSQPLRSVRPAAYDVSGGQVDTGQRSAVVTLTVWVGSS
jgi:hypothetical protein